MGIHPTAIVDPKADLDSTVEVGPYCVIEGHVRVGAGCRLYHGVYLTGWTQIDRDCILHPGVIVGHEPQDTKYGGERSYCRVGRGTNLREYVTIHRGSTPDSETVVGEDCFLLGGSHVGHNCVIGNGVTLINQTLLGGHVTIGDRATLGGGVGVHQFVRVGELVMITGNARVAQDVLPFALTDSQGRISGLNRIGLRRAGIDAEQVREIRSAYRVLFASGLPLPRAITQLGERSHSPPCQRLLDFLEGVGPRGLAGRSRNPKPQPPFGEPTE